MNVTLYKTKSPRHMVSKSLTDAINITCELKAPTSVINPVLLLGNVDLTGYNYAYIPKFNRYYYINNMDTQYNRLNERQLTVDPLMTYANEIKALNAIVERQERYYNLYLNNLQIPNLSYKRVQTKVFPKSPVNVNPSIILCVTGQ